MNYTDPIELINKFDADTLRLYLISSPASKGETFRFNDIIWKNFIKNLVREISIKMYNDYGLYVDNNFNASKLSTLDVYIIQQINNFRILITNKLNSYDTSNLDKNIIRMIDIVVTATLDCHEIE